MMSTLPKQVNSDGFYSCLAPWLGLYASKFIVTIMCYSHALVISPLPVEKLTTLTYFIENKEFFSI